MERIPKTFIPIYGSIIQKKKEGILKINLRNDENYSINQSFLDKLILPESGEITDVEFRKIRSTPMVKVEGEEYLIIYDLFMFEKVFKGLYFVLNSLNSRLPLEHRISNFRSYYGDHFSEKTLLYGTLERVFKDRYIKYSGEQILQKGIDAEPDYYIRNGNKILLIESKDFLIKAEVKNSANYQLIEKEITKKLYKDGGNKKAVLQLINNIHRLLNKELEFDTNYKEKNIRIYPIIVVHDVQCVVPGINTLINGWFDEELIKLKERGIIVKNVRPITLVSIDALIFNEDILVNKKLDLFQVIDEYHKQTIVKKKNFANEAEYEQHVNNTLLPFDVFLNGLVAKKKLRKGSKLLSEMGLSLFD